VQSRQGATVQKCKRLTICSMELKKAIQITSISMVAARASDKGMSEQARCDCAKLENTYFLLDGIQKELHISSISMVAARASDKGMSEQARCDCAKVQKTYHLLDGIKKSNPDYVDIDGGSACKR